MSHWFTLNQIITFKFLIHDTIPNRKIYWIENSEKLTCFVIPACSWRESNQQHFNITQILVIGSPTKAFGDDSKEFFRSLWIVKGSFSKHRQYSWCVYEFPIYSNNDKQNSISF